MKSTSLKQKNPEDAEVAARDKFGNNYLIDDVEVTEIKSKEV